MSSRRESLIDNSAATMARWPLHDFDKSDCLSLALAASSPRRFAFEMTPGSSIFVLRLTRP